MPVKKEAAKRLAKKCFFCDEPEYEVLDLHRLVPGSEGGTYHRANRIVCCSTCHRRCHSGSIVVDPRKYKWTGPGYVLHYWVGGREWWTPELYGHLSRYGDGSVQDIPGGRPPGGDVEPAAGDLPAERPGADPDRPEDRGGGDER